MADEFYGQRDVMRTPEPEEFRQLRPRRATPFPPNLAFPNPNLGSRLLLEQSQPVVRRFVLQAVHSKTRLDLPFPGIILAVRNCLDRHSSL
jgi:hypothetical protein